MKKQLIAFISILIILIAAIPLTVSAASGSVSFTSSTTSLTVGGEVTLTVKYTSSTTVGGGTARITYDSNMFSYASFSGSGTTNSNAAGVIQYTFADTSQSSTYSFSVKFKSKQTGNGNFKLTSSDLVDFDENPFTVSDKSVSVSVTNPTQSSNANLASLKPSSGTLTPKFSASVTSYTIAVPYTTTSLSLSATTADKGAKTAISGKNALAVGKNTRVITVTAPSGATKQYTVVITRAQQQQTDNNTTGTTVAPPAEDPLEVELGGVLMNIADTQPSVELPQGFSWSSIIINEMNISAAINQTVNLTLVYLTNPADNSGAFHIYDEAADKFYPFSTVAVSGGSYILRELPDDLVPPAGTVVGKKTFGTVERDVFLFEDTALADIALVYATAPGGNTALYVYDQTDGSMQLYRTLSAPVDTTPAPELPGNAFTRFVTQYRTIILICAAAVGGIGVLIGGVVLLVIFLRRDKTKGKH